MKKFIFSIATLFMLGILITSCQKELIDEPTDDLSINQNLKRGEGLTRLEVGKSLQRLIKNRSTNRMLVSTLGDDELPLFQLADSKGESSMLGDLLNESNTPVKGIENVDPLLNLFIYYPNEEEDFGKPIVNVVVVDEQNKEAVMLDAKGNTSEISDNSEITQVTLVLKTHESLVALNPRTLIGLDGRSYVLIKDMLRFITPIKTTSSHDIYEKGDIEDLENVTTMIPFDFDDEDPWDLFCSNGIQDFWEDGVDCGGPFCVPCQNTETCNDGVQNGWETGIDCGGPFCEPCEVYAGVCGYEADRDVNPSKDYLHKFKLADCGSWKAVHEIWEGKYYEFRIDVIFADANGEVSNVRKTKSIHRKYLRKKKWGSCKETMWYDFSPDLDIVTWDPLTYGDAMKYIWTEEDTGAEISIPFTIKSKFEIPGIGGFEVSAGITLKFKDKDDLLGESVVEYCDNTEGHGTAYNTGDVAFYVRQH